MMSPFGLILYHHHTAALVRGKPIRHPEAKILMRKRTGVMLFCLGVVLGIAATGLILKSWDLMLTAAQLGARSSITMSLFTQEDAWNKGDLELFMGFYWNSPELVFRSGDDITKGYDATLARYKKKYQEGGAEMGQLSFTDIDIQFVTHDDAIVTGRWKLKRKADEPCGLFTLRLKRLPEGWRIISDHTSSKEK